MYQTSDLNLTGHQAFACSNYSAHSFRPEARRADTQRDRDKRTDEQTGMIVKEIQSMWTMQMHGKKGDGRVLLQSEPSRRIKTDREVRGPLESV